MNDYNPSSWEMDATEILERINKIREISNKFSFSLAGEIIAFDKIDLLSEYLPKPYGSYFLELNNNICEIENVAKRLHKRFGYTPAAKYITGERLSPEDYYVLLLKKVVWSAKDGGISEMTDYEAFDIFYYQDNEISGYIIPNLSSQVKETLDEGEGVIKASITIAGQISPEKVNCNSLREEQIAFFQKYFPEVFAKFQR